MHPMMFNQSANHRS